MHSASFGFLSWRGGCAFLKDNSHSGLQGQPSRSRGAFYTGLQPLSRTSRSRRRGQQEGGRERAALGVKPTPIRGKDKLAKQHRCLNLQVKTNPTLKAPVTATPDQRPEPVRPPMGHLRSKSIAHHLRVPEDGRPEAEAQGPRQNLGQAKPVTGTAGDARASAWKPDRLAGRGLRRAPAPLSCLAMFRFS